MLAVIEIQAGTALDVIFLGGNYAPEQLTMLPAKILFNSKSYLWEK